jgi:hypothetical protein
MRPALESAIGVSLPVIWEPNARDTRQVYIVQPVHSHREI